MKRVYPRWTSPAGIAVWPKIAEPDTKFHPEGEYSIQLRFTGEQADAVRQQITTFARDAYRHLCEEQGKKKLKPADLPLRDDEDGSLLLKAKLKAKVTSKSGSTWEQRPAVFDSRGRMLKGDDIPNVGGGSLVKACVEVAPFYTATIGAGITLRLKAVQVLTLVEYGSGEVDAKSMGFDAEEVGFVSGGEQFDTVATADDIPF